MIVILLWRKNDVHELGRKYTHEHEYVNYLLLEDKLSGPKRKGEISRDL